MRTIILCAIVCLLGFSCEKENELSPAEAIMLDRLFSEDGEDHTFTIGYDVLREAFSGSTLRQRSLVFTSEDVLSNDTLRGNTDAFIVYIEGDENEINSVDTDLNSNFLTVTFYDQLDLQNNTAGEGFAVLKEGNLNLEVGNSGAATIVIGITHPDGRALTFRWSGELQPAETFF